MAEILALIPARGGSKSIPFKNLVPLAGLPLLAYSIRAGQKSRLITRVVVSTDSARIREVALAHGAEAPFLRPAELARDHTTDLPVFQHALNWLAEHEGYRPDLVVQLRPTSPLRRPAVLDEAIGLLLEDPLADSVRGVARPRQNPFKMWWPGDPYLRPLLDAGIPEAYNQPRQKLPEVYWQIGYVDVIRPRVILEEGSMSGRRIRPILIEDACAIDIDDLSSVRLAEELLARDPSLRP